MDNAREKLYNLESLQGLSDRDRINLLYHALIAVVNRLETVEEILEKAATGPAEASGTRRRANVRKNSRGYSWDCTVERHGCSNQELLEDLEELVALMERDYGRAEE